MNQVVPILAVLVWVATFLLYRPAFFRRPLQGGRRWLLALIQTIPILLLCWLMGNPFAERTGFEVREGVVVVLVDDSPSMGFEDGETDRPRFERANEWAEGLVREKQIQRAPGRWVLHRLGEFIPKGRSGSDFAEAFEGIRRGIPNRLLDGVVFLSDGQDRSEASLERSVRNLGVPLHTIGLGTAEEQDRVRVRWRDAPARVHPGSPFLVRWSVDSNQDREEAYDIRVTFASEEVHRERVSLPEADERLEEWLTLRGETPGPQILRIEVRAENRPEMASIAEATVTVTENPKTLLVLESEPTRLVQSLVQTALESGRFRVVRPFPHPEGGGVVWDLFRPLPEPGVDTVQPWEKEKRERLAPPEWEGALEDLLSQTSVAVLGRNPLGGAPENWARTLAEAPRKERLDWLVLPGSERSLDRVEGTELSNLLQRVGDRRESRDSLRLVIAETGIDHPALAPLWSHREGVWEIGRDTFFYSTTPTTQVLLSDGQDRALIVQVPFALGKATLFSIANLWKLRAHATATEQGRRDLAFLSGLWLGILDDLSGSERSEEIGLRIEPEVPAVAQTVRIRIQDPALAPGPPRGGLEIREAGLEWRSLLLTPDSDWSGLGEAVWTPRSAGDYEIRYAGLETGLQIAVSDQPTEAEDVSLNEKVLQTLAELSRGSYTAFSEVENSGFDLRPETRRIERTDRTPLRHDLWIGVLVAGLFCMGWGIRRAWSLP